MFDARQPVILYKYACLLFILFSLLLISTVTYTDTAAVPDGQQILVWTVNGAPAPGQQGASNPGQIVLMDGAGNMTPVIDVPEQTRFVEACGDEAVSPDNNLFAFYVGIDDGDLYLMNGTDAPVVIDDVPRLVCLGAGSFQFSPDSSKLAYIAYEPGAGTDDFADGFLKVYDTSSGEFVFETESVTSFDISDDSVAFINFFTNDRQEADEAAIQVWADGNDREVATLRPDSEECRFVSGSVGIIPDGNLLAILGHTCRGTGGETTWQLYTIDPSERSATRSATGTLVGNVYQSFARTNAQYISPDGGNLLFTVPDGITANTVGLFGTTISDLSPTAIVERQIVMPANTTPANALPALSLDGKMMAVVETSTGNSNMLKLFDLTNFEVAPIELPAGSAGDTISAMEFAPDGSSLYAVVGGDEGDNNAIVAINTTNGADFRVERGRFNNRMVVSPGGSEIVIADWQILEDPNEPPYLNLVALEVDSGASTTLFEGAVIEEGKVVEQSFAVPLAWRGGSVIASTDE